MITLATLQMYGRFVVGLPRYLRPQISLDEAQDAIRPPIDINVPGETELTRLPGVGEVTAKRIVDFREEHGPFRRVEDLLKVKGIGEKSFQKLRSSITVGTPRP